MADSKGSDPKATETKSGAVKPPLLDLKARSSGAEPTKDAAKDPSKDPAKSELGSKPEAPGSTATKPDTSAASASKPTSTPGASAGSTDKAKAETSKPATAAKPASAAPGASGAGFGFGAAIVGGLLGLGAAYGLAYAGLWPAPAPTPAVADPRLASFDKAIPALQSTTESTQAAVVALTDRVDALEKAAPASAPDADTTTTDSGTLQDDLAALSARVDSLANAPATGADPAALDGLRSDLAALGSRIDELASRMGTAEANLRSLDSSVAQTSAQLASQPSDIGAVLQLPLILSGFETAFATGRPYETELAALRAADPKAEIPTAIANQAAQGLTRPDVIARRFDSVLPAILAGRPADPNAGWQDGALDWLAGAIALRPTGEIEGDTPDAIVSRLVGAVDRRDFTTAQTLLKSLPASMQSAAQDIPALFAEQAQAEAFLQSLRDAALKGEVTQ